MQLFMNIPFTACYFATYESGKKMLGADDTEDEGLLVQLVAGGMAGGAAAAITNPLDVVKTRLQLEGVNSARRYGSTSFVSCLHAICLCFQGHMHRVYLAEQSCRWALQIPAYFDHVRSKAIE